MKNIKVIISLLLVLTLLPYGGISAFGADNNYWDAYENGVRMPFRPPDGYVSEQNPPDFTWPYIEGASRYWLVISRDEAFNSVDIEQKNLNQNYYNCNTPLETGVRYYWKVCAFVNNTQTEWSRAKSFRIDPDAAEFIVPGIDALINRVSTSHPRVFTTDLESFRAIKDKNELSKKVYDRYMSNAFLYRLKFSKSFPPDPDLSAADYWNKEFNTYYPDKYTEYVYGMNAYKTKSAEMLAAVTDSSFAYLLSGDEETGAFAKKVLLELSSWDIEGATSHVFDNQRHREIVYRCAMAYDWLYNLMTEDERKTVRDMIYNRITHVYTVKRYRTNADGSIMTDGSGNPITSNSLQSMSDIFANMKKNPLDSHGWTTIGYLGIAAYSLLGDFKRADSSLETDTAETWLRDVLPLYTAIMHPWSNQDGGWSQGTAYWRYGTNSSKEFIDILALGGVINLYEKAWSKNEYLWALYAYPTGSYGSFGDGANRDKSEAFGYTRNSMAKSAYFTGNQVAAWISKSQGGPDENEMYNYYSAQALEGEVKSPDGYPLSHTFTDVGWTVMTNSLTAPDRIQLTFKSSPYGTYNHSQQDQNAFIIQGFGENLAIKSGFYDYYASEHDKNVSRATYARNTITVDNRWQLDQNIDADSETVQFVNGSEFDSVMGSAAKAYGGALDKYDRTILYLRPDAFIVVDDLDAAGNSESTFEWWLNALSDIEWTDSSALISQGSARLRANVHYPKDTTAVYYDRFINPQNGKEYIPTGSYADKEPHKRVAFSTPKCAETKMVVSMNVFKSGSAERTPAKEYFDNYMKLKYDGGKTVVYVNTGDNNIKISAADGIEFTGTALVLSDTSVMLANGTYLKIGDEEILKSADTPVSAVLEDGRLNISGGEDFKLSVDSFNKYINLSDIAKLKDEKQRELSSAIGITAEAGGDGKSVVFSAEGGSYKILSGQDVVELKAENISVQKSADGSAAVFWNEEAERSYDVKIGDEVFEDKSSPFLFTIGSEDGVKSVSIRECMGGIDGDWSEPLYISSYDKEYRGKIEFEKSENGDVWAKTIAIPSYGEFYMYLAGYDKNGVLKEAVLGEAAGYSYSAKVKEPEGGAVKAFVFGKNLSPLAPAAFYNSDSTDLSAIYINGKALEDFDNSKDAYIVKLSSLGALPYVRVYLKDNSSEARISYDENDLSVEIVIASQSGRERKIKLKFEVSAK